MANYEFFGDHFSVIGQLTNVLSMEAIILGLASTREHPRQPNTALWELVRGNMGNMLPSNINNRSNPSQCVLYLKYNMPLKNISATSLACPQYSFGKYLENI